VTRKQYISLILIIHFIIGMFIVHKIYSIDIQDEFMITEGMIEEQKIITNNVDARLQELQIAMDSAYNLGEAILEKKTQETSMLKKKYERLDIENTQLSNAINDMILDTIVLRDTIHISHKK